MPVKETGPVVLLSSGESLPSSGKIHEFAVRHLPDKPRIVILETPAGFEPNSDAVARKIKDFLARRLQNYKPTIDVVPARRRGTPFSPDNPDILTPILKADEILLGPGSPTYSVRQLRDSLAFQLIAARQRRGGTLFLSSSATLTFGAYTLPVYEIYKVGEDLHWKAGLNFFSFYGLALTIISHWNNKDGGDELDTSRCYMGRRRFNELLKMLPPDQTIVGIDEHTAVVIDFVQGYCHVRGKDTVTILRNDKAQVFQTGSSFPLDILGEWHIPEGYAGIEQSIWEQAIQVEKERETEKLVTPEPSEEVLSLTNARSEARVNEDWVTADALREQVAALGWLIKDTPDGSELIPLEEK
jgi:hypothetical protein